MESHFKSFSTKITSKIQRANVFSSCFQKSTKNLISQNLIVHDILGKRKISDDQIRKGLKNLGVLDQLEKTQICFPSYFWQKRNWHQKKLWMWWNRIILFQKKYRLSQPHFTFYKSVRNANCSSFCCLLQHQNNYRWFQK